MGESAWQVAPVRSDAKALPRGSTVVMRPVRLFHPDGSGVIVGPMLTAVIDIGTPGKSLGWAAVSNEGNETDGSDVDECIQSVALALASGPVALGFEAPMWVPTRLDVTRLTSARRGESGAGLASRPFSASAGATVLVTGLVVVTYVLRKLIALVPSAVAGLDWRAPLDRPGQLLLWEAFVTNQKKVSDTRHVEDAHHAIRAFRAGMLYRDQFHSSVEEPDCLSLLGACMLKADWIRDASVLNRPCLVVRTN